MKHIRMFENAEQAAAILPTLEYNTLSAIRGESGIALKPGVPPPDPKTLPFYIENMEDNEITLSIGRLTDITIASRRYAASALQTNISYKFNINDEYILLGTVSGWSGKGGSVMPASYHTINIPAKSKIYVKIDQGRCSTVESDDDDVYGRNIQISSNGNIAVGGRLDQFLENTENTGGGACAYLFYNCTNLIDALNLVCLNQAKYYDYYAMFYGCTALTTAPELPAITLGEKCYQYMFNGCTNLAYIKCLATDISATGCCFNWVSGVSSTGTFVKNSSMASWTTGTSGIPSGWTVQDA